MMSKTAIFALAAAASLNVPAAFAASFPCDKAKSETEKVVCATPDLSTRDELVASIFKKAINTSGKEGLGALARRLLAARDACGSDTSCIAVNQIRALEIFALLGSTGGKPVGDQLTYGGKAPMKVTITGASGLGTSKATITVAHLRADAVNECTAFNASRTDCVEAVLNTPLAAAISANCETGEFTSLYGQSLVYAGEEQIRDAQSGEALAAAQASGYYAALEQFSALCPNRVAQ